MIAPKKTGRFATFAEFYPFYLSEHSNPVCRKLHFVGTTLVLATLTTLVFTGDWSKAWLLPVFGYGFAWVGHFAFEKNRPASFKQPFFSLVGDFVMFWQLLSGRIPFDPKAPKVG
jgi:hypothetical protein